MLGRTCDIVSSSLEYDFTINDLELQSSYCFHFQTNTLGKA